MYIETKTKFFTLKGKIEDGYLRFLSISKANSKNTIDVLDVSIWELLSILECFLRGMLSVDEKEHYKIIFLKHNNGKKEACISIKGLLLSKLEATILKNILNLWLKEHKIKYYKVTF
jgi:hypothetical protein